MHSHSHSIEFFWRQRQRGLSLTDVLWHGLFSAEMRTAKGFDSVHSKYPASNGTNKNRRLSRHSQASSTSECVTAVKKWGLQLEAHFATWQWPVKSCDTPEFVIFFFFPGPTFKCVLMMRQNICYISFMGLHNLKCLSFLLYY